jgi:hypothetical protein
MAVNSEPNEGSRKTLDEIRRELEAEYGFVDAEPVASHVREAAVDERPNDARLFRARPQAPKTPEPPPRRWDDDDDVSDERVEQLFARHQLSMGRRADDDERPRRSGYLLAALIGCVAGQALLLGFLLVTQHRLSADLLRTTLGLSPRAEAPAPAAPPVAAPATAKESAPVKEEEVAQPKDEPAQLKDEPAQSIVSTPADADPASAVPPPPPDLPARTAVKPAPQAGGSRRPEATRAPATPEPQRSLARQRPSRDGDVADSQARLRYALNEWLRTAAHGGGPVQSTEPVIVLGPDGRTAKTYVSIASPVGLVPREQRWELGARGWSLLEDRQVGLPRAGTTNTLR